MERVSRRAFQRGRAYNLSQARFSLRDATMHFDSFHSTVSGVYHVGSTTAQDPIHAAPKERTSTARSLQGVSDQDCADLLRQIATIIDGDRGGRITLTLSIAGDEAHGPPQPVRIVADPEAPAL